MENHSKLRTIINGDHPNLHSLEHQMTSQLAKTRKSNSPTSIKPHFLSDVEAHTNRYQMENDASSKRI